MSKNANDIYKLKMHETVIMIDSNGDENRDVHITRVPSGWIYTFVKFGCNDSAQNLFIPYQRQQPTQ